MKKIAKFITTVFFVSTFSAQANMDFETKQSVMSSIIKVIKDKYVDVHRIKGILNNLQQLSKTTEYQAVISSEKYADLITSELSKTDKHFTLQWSEYNFQNMAKSKKEPWFTKLNRKNSGFNRVEILEGNIGYIDFWGFDQVSEQSKEIVSTVLKFVANTDALLIDLRDNGGGSGEMVQLISSYFLKPSTHLNSIYSRESNTTHEFYTYKIDAVDHPLTMPIYILVDDETFSAAEEFAYNFKHLNRAVLVGESTKGGANPWVYFPLKHGFRVGVPIARAVNPFTNTNWEGVGVEPDLISNSEGAFDVAYKAALNKVKKTVTDVHQLSEINKETLN